MFNRIPHNINYLFTLDPAEMEIVEEIPVEFSNEKGVRTITTVTRTSDDSFTYKLLPFHLPKLYLIEGNDTLKTIAQNKDGFFDFQQFFYQENYVFAMDAEHAVLADELPIRFADKEGRETFTTITKTAGQPFVYEYLPEKKTRLYLIQGGDTMMIVTQNQRGIFDFQQLPYLENYVFVLDDRNAELIDEIPIRFADSQGNETLTTITKAKDEPFVYEYLPEKKIRLYVIHGNDTVMIVTQNQSGIFDFQKLPYLKNYVFALHAKDVKLIDEIPIRFADSQGNETLTTITKTEDKPFVYEYLPEKKTRLYVIHGNDTVMVITQNQSGVFDFQQLPYLKNYVFAVHPKDVKLIDEIPIRFADRQGKKTLTTITKAEDDPFVYEYLPEKKTRLYLIQGNDTLMIVTQNQRGIFDFHKLPYLENYVFAMDGKDADLIGEIPIRFADSQGKETLTTITKSEDEPFVYEYLPEKQTRLYLIQGKDTLMIVTQNQRGIFDFQELPYLENYVLALDSGNAALIEELNIKVATGNGKDTVITVSQSKVKPTIYQYFAKTSTTASIEPEGDPPTPPSIDRDIGKLPAEQSIYFDFNASSLNDDIKRTLSVIIDKLNKNPDLIIQLEGHTDSKGSDAYNKKLSIWRSQTALLYLVNKGISIKRISVYYFGESNPVASNDNIEGRKLNRRVSVSFHNPLDYKSPSEDRLDSERLLSSVNAGVEGGINEDRSPDAENPESKPFIRTSETTVCRSISNMQPVEAGNVFPADVGTLWLFTKIQRRGEPSAFITHVWYYGAREMARVKLTVKGAQWRTYSSKIISPIWKGKWRVEVLSDLNETIKTVAFQIQ